jgi:hypothetical protein
MQTKENRKKTYNYTDRQDRVIRNLQLMKENKVSFDSPKSLYLASGYTDTSAEDLASRPNTGMAELLAEVFPLKERAETIKRVAKKAEDAQKYGSVLKAIELVSKIDGTLAPIKTELEVKGNISHTVQQDEGEYAKFLKSRNQNKLIIDGEVVEEGEVINT